MFNDPLLERDKNAEKTLEGQKIEQDDCLGAFKPKYLNIFVRASNS